MLILVLLSVLTKKNIFDLLLIDSTKEDEDILFLPVMWCRLKEKYPFQSKSSYLLF